ncbi:dynein heavy chain [Marasmius crinis-equi]|uniref:Dynein heavy chain n=1 Tax=Marasmius crinis-equi TaxID=585013 RepID=A0ABR3FVW5_9AGAR
MLSSVMVSSLGSMLSSDREAAVQRTSTTSSGRFDQELTNVAREVTRKRSERFISIKVVPAHTKLQERTRYLRNWRKQHEQLAVMTGPTKGLAVEGFELGGIDMEEEVKEAYEIVKRIDVLDVSVKGTEIWVAAEHAYNEWVSRVENQIIVRLRDWLGTVRNANETFRVFSKFNALFVRPKIRGAIQECQMQLIDLVKEDVKHLHDKPNTAPPKPTTCPKCATYPPIAGAIIWAHQIERQLVTYMKRIEAVLGKGQKLYAPGSKTSTDGTRALTGGEFYGDEYRNAGQRMIGKGGGTGMNIKWDHFVSQYNTGRYIPGSDGRNDRHIQFVREFASAISVLQDKTNSVINLYKDILRAVEELSPCSYTTEAFAELLGRVQSAIDRLNLEATMPWPALMGR